jgi:hypothetical protein
MAQPVEMNRFSVLEEVIAPVPVSLLMNPSGLPWTQSWIPLRGQIVARYPKRIADSVILINKIRISGNEGYQDEDLIIIATDDHVQTWFPEPASAPGAIGLVDARKRYAKLVWKEVSSFYYELIKDLDPLNPGAFADVLKKVTLTRLPHRCMVPNLREPCIEYPDYCTEQWDFLLSVPELGGFELCFISSYAPTGAPFFKELYEALPAEQRTASATSITAATPASGSSAPAKRQRHE